MKKEKEFQARLKTDILTMFPNSIVKKEDGIQGFPDLLVLCGDRWATLECKRDAKAPHRPNQDIYVKRMNDMSFSSFVYPENLEDVLSRLFSFFEITYFYKGDKDVRV